MGAVGIPYAAASVKRGRLYHECPACGASILESADPTGEATSTNYATHYLTHHQSPEDNTMSTTPQQAPATAEKYVYDAVRAVGEKFAELNDEQRARALAAPSDKPGLRGKSLGRWIVDGLDSAQQAALARQEREAAKAAEATARRSASQKAAAEKPERKPRESKYPENIRAAVKRSKVLRGKSHGEGPAQHVVVRDVVSAAMKADGLQVAPASIATFSGVGSVAELFALAAGEAPREALKPLQKVGALVPEDTPSRAWTQGRFLAAILAAWCDELQAARR